MDKCKLCKLNDADDTGSHVVPHFLLKRIFNVANTKGRDKEISFKLTASNVETSFGRSVQPEKLEEVFGKLTDEEQEKKAIADLVVDHEWCKSCEKKFAQLESFYAKTLTITQEKLYQSTTDSLAALMFWLSIIWRGSITGRTDLKLSEKDARKIRKLLNDYKPGAPNAEFIAKWASVLNEISYKVYRSPDYHKKIDLEHGTFFYTSKSKQPYSMMIDEFAVLIYMKKSYLNGVRGMFLGFEKLDALSNNFTAGEIVYPLSVKDFSLHIGKLVEFFKGIKLQWYESILNRLYHKIGHQGNMPLHIKDEVLAQVTKDETKIGRKYTYDDFVKCSTEVVMKHHVELRQINKKR
jgi:hypothetical protein